MRTDDTRGASNPIGRRDLLRAAGSMAGTGLLLGSMEEQAFARPAPSLPVAIARCESYERATVLARMSTVLDHIGGLKPLVANKTVTVKVNLVNTPAKGVAGLPSNRTYHVHPNMALALATLLDRAGARRIRFVESTFSTEPIERFYISGGWHLRDFEALKTPVEFEDTRNLGKGTKYVRVKVPTGGSLYPAYDLNHSYVDTDVYISFAKLKNHATAGLTLSMKNNFGITPTALYGQPEHDERSVSNRGNFHGGDSKLPAGLPGEVAPNSPRVPSYRVPRHIVDVVQIRPIDLAIIDGVESVSGGEGPWIDNLRPLQPHLMAARATGPFPGDNHLAMAAALGLGSNNPSRIEVVGLSIKEALYPYRWTPRDRNT